MKIVNRNLFMQYIFGELALLDYNKGKGWILEEKDLLEIEKELDKGEVVYFSNEKNEIISKIEKVNNSYVEQELERN